MYVLVADLNSTTFDACWSDAVFGTIWLKNRLDLCLSGLHPLWEILDLPLCTEKS